MMGTRTTTIARNIDASTYGGEASLVYAFATGWRAEASLASVRGVNETDGRPLAQQPPLEGRFGLSYATSTWTVGSLLRMVARQDRFAVNQGNIVGQDLGASAGFAVLSLNAGWRPTPRCQISVGVDNLFDKTYAEHLSRGGAMVAGFPPPSARVNEPGRSFWAKVDLRF
jgi:iron complex outermembrane receptor protein